MAVRRAASVVPYVPRLTIDWLSTQPEVRTRRVAGTLVLADVSGFTALSERLTASGPEGAERLTDVIDACFGSLLQHAYAEDGRLLTFGGDALLLLYDGDDHQLRAVRAAARMRRALRAFGPQRTDRGSVTLRVSMGVHSGEFDAALVGSSSRQLVLCGPQVTALVRTEHAARPGQILLTPPTAAALPPRLVAVDGGGGNRLRRTPQGKGAARHRAPPSGADEAAVEAVPLALREHLHAGVGSPEHRTVTVGFLQVRGLDAAAADVIRLAADLERVVGAVQDACDDLGVTVLGSDVDADAAKLVLVAGAPNASEDDEQRMLLALRRVVDAGLPLPVRAGVHRGGVYCGDVGPAHRRTYTVMGDAVNLAARLMARAPDGTVLATHEVVDRSRVRFSTEDLEPFPVKGKRHLVHATIVGGTRPSPAGATELRAPALVGRDAEIATLTALWDRARDGAGGAAQVVGEPGLGKTRLLDELVARAGVQPLTASADLQGRASPYRVARALLLAALGIDGDDSAGLARAVSVAQRADPELAAEGTLLSDVLGVEVTGTADVAGLADEARRQRTVALAARLLAVARPGPLLVVVEDVHWVDDATADLLDHVAKLASALPWCVVTTRRDSRGGFVQDRRHGPVLPLLPLDERAVAALAAQALAGRPLPPARLAALTRRAGGNPLFLRELVASAHELADDALPDSLDTLLAARLDRLGPRDRDLVCRAAVLGQRFPGAHVDLVLGPSTTVPGPAAFDRVSAFLGPVDDEQVAFVHALVRDAAYRRLPFALRRSLHGVLADTLVARGDDVDGAVLSYHQAAAHRWADAWRSATAAGSAAMDASAPVEAAELLERALLAARHLGDRLAESERVEAGLLLARAYERSGSFDLAERTYSRTGTASTDPLLAARVLVQRAWLAERQSRLRLGVRRARAAARRLDRVRGEPAGRCLAQALTVEGTCLEVGGRHAEAAVVLRRALDEATRVGDRRTQAHAGSILDWALAMTGRSTEATNLESSLQIYRDLDDLGGQATCLTNLGALAYLRGDWGEAVRCYEEGRAVQLRAGDVTSAALGAANTGEVRSDQGHWDEAAACLDNALTVWRATGHQHGVAWATGLQGRLLARIGAHEQAARVLGEAEGLHRAVGSTGDADQVRLWSAEQAVLSGEASTALARLDQGADDGSATALRVRGSALLLHGDVEAAARTLETAYREALDGDPYEQVLVGETLDRLGRLGDRAGDCARLRTQLGVVRTTVLPVGYL